MIGIAGLILLLPLALVGLVYGLVRFAASAIAAVCDIAMRRLVHS